MGCTPYLKLSMLSTNYSYGVNKGLDFEVVVVPPERFLEIV